jgi:Amt family ammonium transporter
VLDFAGGIAVHAIAGMAALASVFFVGRRKVTDPGMHSLPLVALGTGLLWFGWYGFNAGSELQVDAVTAQAFMNTDTAASFAGITWLIMAWIVEKKPKFVGLLTGAVAGLATITPCAGYVSIHSAVLIGILAGLVCYLAISLKKKMNWDDALDVWGVHGVGGILGTLLLGVFSSLAINPNGSDGLLNGNAMFFLKEAVAVISVSLYAFIFSWLVLWLTDKVIPVRTTQAEELEGLDATLHGERAYI